MLSMHDLLLPVIGVAMCAMACRSIGPTGSSTPSSNRVIVDGDAINTSHDDRSKIIFEGDDNTIVFEYLDALLNSKHRRDVIIVEGDGNMVRITHRGTIDNSVLRADTIVIKGDHRAIEILQEFLMDNSYGSRENYTIDLNIEDLSADLMEQVRMDSTSTIENKLTGTWVPLKEAINTYMKEAALGDLNAAFYLGEIYLLGVGLEVDARRAVDHYLMAARRGHVDSQFALGHVYETNYEGVGIDMERAHHWYSEAAKSGDARAQQKLAILKNE